MATTTAGARYKAQADEGKRFIETEKSKADTAYFLSNHVKIYETRKQYGIGWKPFRLWPRQVEFVHWAEDRLTIGEDGAVRKSRDVGATTLLLGITYKHWLFDEDFHAFTSSLREEDVKLTPGHDTHFSKLRDFLVSTPEWMMPKGFKQEKNLMSLTLENPATGNAIIGRNSKNLGVGRRSTMGIVDEYSKFEEDISEVLRHTSPTVFYPSTVMGLDFFWDLCEAYKPSGRLFVFHWRDSLNHDDDWYNRGRADALAKNQLHIFKREVDQDPRAAKEGQIYPNIEKCPRGNYGYNPDWPLYLIWDFGFADAGYLGFLQRDPKTGDLYLIDEVFSSRVSIHWYVPFVPGKVVTEAAVSFRYSPEDNDRIILHKQWRGPGGASHYGDPTGNQRTAASGKSVFDELSKYGIHPRCKAGWQNMSYRQEKASQAINRLHIGHNCHYFYDSFTQFVVPKRSENSTAEPKTGVHRWSHAPSAFEAFAISEPALVDPDKEEVPEERYDRWAVKGRN